MQSKNQNQSKESKNVNKRKVSEESIDKVQIQPIVKKSKTQKEGPLVVPAAMGRRSNRPIRG